MNKTTKQTKSDKKGDEYYPGMYHKSRPKVYDIVERAFKDWQKDQAAKGKKRTKKFPMICFSRNIGVGALEIADILGKKIGYRVIDREILEHIVSREHLDKKLEAFIDERCPSEIEDILSMLFGEKSFTQNEYSRLLFRTIFSVADIGPAIFVGRGAHLILPRDRVLAVRLICSTEYRIKRLAAMLKIPDSAASIKIRHYDIDQKNFFRRVYNLESAPASEFDMVINKEYIHDTKAIAEIVEVAFREKFGDEYIRAE
jgi:cytidylate kinase